MDGTSLLFEPLIAHVPAGFKVTPLSLRQEPYLSYTDQAEHILSKIESENTIIVAESYSGRVAYDIAQIQPERIKHIVFAASFLTRPSTLARIAPFLPLQLLKNGIIPSPIIGRLAFGRDRSNRLTELLEASLHQVDTAVLRHRLKQISTLQIPTKTIEIPCTYIRARSDNLVSAKAVESFKDICSNLTIREVAGSHFILQTNPRACWKAIREIAQQ